jgi:hypothetical protein
VPLDQLYKGTNGILIRAGDVDNDGYPDLLFVTHSNGKSSVRLFMNEDGGKGDRKFEERFDKELGKVEHAVGAAFFDLHEDVSLW